MNPLTAGDRRYDIDADVRPGNGSSGPQQPGCDHFRDSDGDGLPDWFEWEAIGYSDLDAATALSHTTAASDLDGDGWTLAQELLYGGLPGGYDSLDSDEDGLADIFERQYPGQPNAPYRLDPYNFDTDGDRLPDGWEVAHGLDPPAESAQGSCHGVITGQRGQ